MGRIPFFHSTLDVVFNTAPFHIMFTPDLLKNLLLNWPKYSVDGHLPHDMGRGFIIGKNQYPVKMSIEEDTNYLLLSFLYFIILPIAQL